MTSFNRLFNGSLNLRILLVIPVEGRWFLWEGKVPRLKSRSPRWRGSFIRFDGVDGLGFEVALLVRFCFFFAAPPCASSSAWRSFSLEISANRFIDDIASSKQMKGVLVFTMLNAIIKSMYTSNQTERGTQFVTVGPVRRRCTCHINVIDSMSFIKRRWFEFDVYIRELQIFWFSFSSPIGELFLLLGIEVSP